jgi:hypothetical protein
VAEEKAPTKEIGRPGMAGSVGGLLPWSVWFDDREYAPDVKWPQSVKTYRRMQTDAQLKGLLMATTLPIRRRRWEIDPNGAKPEVVAHTCASLNLPQVGAETPQPRRRRKRFDFDRHIGHAFQALTYGHYFFEETYDYRDPRQGGDGLYHLAKLGTRPPRTVMNIATEDDGSLKGIQQNIWVGGGPALAGGATFGPIIDANRLLVYLWDTEDDGDWVGKSMLRACLRDWLVKDALIRVDAAKHQRNGMGVPWFEVDPNASDKQVKELAAIAERWRAGEASGGAGPGKLTLKGVDGDLPDTIRSIRYHDEQMSKAFLLLFFNLGGDATSGSKALGSEFVEWYAEGGDAVAGWLTDSTQEQIEREVELNWGEDEQPPALVSRRTESEELSFADLVKGYETGLLAIGASEGEEDQGDAMMSELGAYITQRWHLPRSVGRISVPDASSPAPPPPEPATPPSARQPARSAAASSLEAAITRPMRWADAARAAGMDPKHGTARRARDQLLAAGAIVRGADGRLAPVAPEAGMQLPGRELRREPTQAEVDAAVDFATMEEVYTSGRDTLVEAVRAAQGAQIDELVEAVAAADGNAAALASLSVEPIPVDLIEEHLLEVAAAGVAAAREERDAQLAPSAGAARPAAAAEPEPDQDAIDRQVHERAEAAALTLAAGLAASASKRAAAVSALPPDTAAADVRDHLEGLKGAALEEQIGGAVAQAYNTGRREFIRVGDAKAVFASEILDGNTCSACSGVDGTEWPTLAEAEVSYPVGGFVECEAGLRCRGTLIATY